jgi:hypothetical protein
LRLELDPSVTDVRNAERKNPSELGKRDGQVPGLVLDPLLARCVRVPREPKRLAVERVGPRRSSTGRAMKSTRVAWIN